MGVKRYKVLLTQNEIKLVAYVPISMTFEAKRPVIHFQWRIQDFPEEGALIPKGGAPTYYLANFSRKLHKNKKVLLRECKRHTARRIASTRYAALSGGVPHPDLVGGDLFHTWSGGTPSRPGQGSPTIQTWSEGYPIQTWLGSTRVPPQRIQIWDEVPPLPEMGYSPSPDLRLGTPHPHHPDLGWGIP